MKSSTALKRNLKNDLLAFVLTLLIGLGALLPLNDAWAFASEQALLRVEFLDVGQADCMLITTPDQKHILIDGGNKDDGGRVLSMLKDQKVEKLDFIVATHPHEDHIGGLPQVIQQMPVGKVVMPKVSANTKIFESMLKGIKSKGIAVTEAKAGAYLIYDRDVKLQILAPVGTGYDETNEYSAVLKLTYKETSFLLTGDAESASEQQMMDGGYDLKSDVLKVGHHGGRTSTSEAFLKRVAPSLAVISVGKTNDYGHPHQELLARLKGIQVLRTDEKGTITIVSNGQKLTVETASGSKGLVTAAAKKLLVKTQESTALFITKSGKKYHRSGCSGLSHSKIAITLKTAKLKGYGPCQMCHPPQ